MISSFDPYHKWLGISPKDQPPNHYRLLAIDLFEADPDVIASAADQRMAHVRAFQTGKHSALSQEILNEIAAARVCLLNAERKAEYDRQLREQLAVAEGEPASVEESPGVRFEPAPPLPIPSGTPPLDETVPPSLEGELPRRGWYRSKRLWQGVAAILVTAVLFGVAVAVLVKRGSEPIAQNKPKQKPVIQRHKSDQRKPPSNQGTSKVKQDVPGKKPTGKPKQDTPPEKDGPKIDVPPDGKQGNGPPEKLPVPDPSAQAAAEGRLKQAFADASPAELLEAGRTGEYTPEERFVLLQMARDAAAAAADVQTALEAVDEIAQRYEIDLLQMKASAVLTCSAGATTPATFRAVAEKGLALVDQAIAEKQYDPARRIAGALLLAARNRGDSELINQVTLRIIDLEELSQP